jgi:hypothetical protein
MAIPIRVGIMGDFEPAYHSHFATNAALYDAATKLKVPLEVRWLPTPSLERKKSCGAGTDSLLRREALTKALVGCCAELNSRARVTGRLWGLEGASNILC